MIAGIEGTSVMDKALDDLPPQQPKRQAPTEAVIAQRRQRMAALATETEAMVVADRQARGLQEEKAAACLFLDTAIAAVPALAAACNELRREMTAAGASHDEVLAGLLGLARPCMDQAGGMSAPMSVENAVAMIEKF